MEYRLLEFDEPIFVNLFADNPDEIQVVAGCHCFQFRGAAGLGLYPSLSAICGTLSGGGNQDLCYLRHEG